MVTLSVLTRSRLICFVIKNTIGDPKIGVMTDRRKICISTFVAIDLETTGLPSMEYNKTKITEIAIVAVSRENLLNTTVGIPRVTHKLTLCVNPLRMIHPTATDITGLSNDILEKEKHFDGDACHMINLFLSRLTPPICLIAHNGMKFDFPILKAEIAHSQMVVADDLLCVDSLIAFRKLFSVIPHEMLPLYMQKRLNSSQSQSQRKVVDVAKIEACNCMDSVITQISSDSDRSFMQKINESTPKQTIVHSSVLSTPVKTEMSQSQMVVTDDLHVQKQLNSSQSHSQRKVVDVVEIEACNCMDSVVTKISCDSDRSFMQKINESTPKQTIAHSSVPSTPILKVIKAKRRLFTKENEEFQPSLESFKLQDLYKFIYGKEAGDVHKAENDALLIIACMTAMGEEFIKWVDNNAILLRDVQKIR